MVRIHLFLINLGTQIIQQVKSHQVVIRSDAKQFSEVAEGHRGICFKSEVREMVGWSEVAAFTKVQKNTRVHRMKVIFFLNEHQTGRLRKISQYNHTSNINIVLSICALHIYIMFSRCLVAVETWGKRCSPPRRSPASTHLSQAWSSGCPLCNRCPAGWHLSRLRMWSVERGVKGAEGDVVREILAPSLTLNVNERPYTELEQIVIEKKNKKHSS